MRILLIKTSSMGDIIHTLPALTDAMQAIPGIEFDWVVEESFADIPSWHPAVRQVIPIALRQWRKAMWARDTRKALYALYQQLQETPYDLILDAQGLLKSAWLGFLAKGVRVGLDFKSAREQWAALAYQKRYTVNFYQHAVIRMRQLFSAALHYPLPLSAPEFALQRDKLPANTPYQADIVFLHGTTWESKQWPEQYWMQLAKRLGDAGHRIFISGGNEVEAARAMRVAAHPAVQAQPYLRITEMAAVLARAKVAVAVDTGFAHLAAALDVPTVSLYGSTNPEYTGVLGRHAVTVAADFPCAPCLQRHCTYRKASTVTPACYEQITPQRVYEIVQQLLN